MSPPRADSAGGTLMDAVRSRPMGRPQLLIVGLCILINVIDGLDVLAMAFTAPTVSKEWSLLPNQTGLLLSAALAGMGVGALLLSPLADLFGRKPCIVLSVSLAALGMFGAAVATDLGQLVAFRVVTGLGIGGAISSVSSTLIEFASLRSRGLVIGLMAVSFPAGAVIGGALAITFIRTYGWHHVFLAGGTLTVAVLLAVVFFVPESVDFLLTRRPARALERINRILGRLHLPAVEALPEAASESSGRQPRAREFLRAPLLSLLVYVGTIMFLTMFSFYFILNWAPKILVDIGRSTQSGISTGMLMNLGGMAGGLLTGIAVRYLSFRTALIGILLAMGLGLIGFGAVAGNAAIVSAVAVGLGYLMYSSMVVVYLLMTTAFPASVRATGIGLASTVGRVGSVLGPYCGGILLTAGVTVPMTCAILSVPVLLAGVLATRTARS